MCRLVARKKKRAHYEAEREEAERQLRQQPENEDLKRLLAWLDEMIDELKST
jgi:hypothetical protein